VLRIGTKVLLLPLHDPVRLAEDIAVVDQLSNGRLDIGLAAGYRKAEFDAFGIRHDERGARMDEYLEVLTRSLAGETFSYEGKYRRYGEVHIVPGPVQDPVPLWLGGRAPAAMRRAVRYGANLPLADFDIAASKADLASYQTALEKAGKPSAGYGVAALAMICVNKDAETAWRLSEDHILYQQNQYVSWFNETSDRPFGSGLLTSARTVHGPAALVGTPDQVLDQILAYHREVPFTHLSFFSYLPGMRYDDALASLKLFAKEVMPSLRAELS
jgi:alkanesulfonate monooxygenase SsuD/methylene tetrahydromethanopterin reductase-like flavin-dependent oxidoreductase (luciferase family)